MLARDAGWLRMRAKDAAQVARLLGSMLVQTLVACALETRLRLRTDGGRWTGVRGYLRDAGAARAAGEGWCCAGWLLVCWRRKQIFVN